MVSGELTEVPMRLVDKDGNETVYTLIKWGPGGA